MKPTTLNSISSKPLKFFHPTWSSKPRKRYLLFHSFYGGTNFDFAIHLTSPIILEKLVKKCHYMRFWDIPKSHQHPIPCLLHFALVFWIRNLYTLYAAQSIIHQQKWSGIVVEFPTKPPQIKVKPTEIARKADLIACYGKSTQTTHIFVVGRYVWNFCNPNQKNDSLRNGRKFYVSTQIHVLTNISMDFLNRTWWNIGKIQPRRWTTWSKQNPQDSKQETKLNNWLITWAWKKRGVCIIRYITVDWQIGSSLVWDACVKKTCEQ